MLPLKQCLKDIVKIFTEQTLTTKNLSAAENRVSIDSGGYMVLGNWVFVQITLKIKVTLNGNTYWTLMDGFPEPKTPFAGLGGKLSLHGRARECFTLWLGPNYNLWESGITAGKNVW